jgi:hypothetical protein
MFPKIKKYNILGICPKFENVPLIFENLHILKMCPKTLKKALFCMYEVLLVQ